MKVGPGKEGADRNEMACPALSTQADDQALVIRVAEGDATALAGLYDRHAPRLLGLARWLGLTGTDAEDLVHDAFLEIWHQAGSYDAERGTVAAWLSLRIRSRVIDRLRAGQREAKVPVGVGDIGRTHR